jgi:hypothetical protein
MALFSKQDRAARLLWQYPLVLGVEEYNALVDDPDEVHRRFLDAAPWLVSAGEKIVAAMADRPQRPEAPRVSREPLSST